MKKILTLFIFAFLGGMVMAQGIVDPNLSESAETHAGKMSTYPPESH